MKRVQKEGERPQTETIFTTPHMSTIPTDLQSKASFEESDDT